MDVSLMFMSLWISSYRFLILLSLISTLSASTIFSCYSFSSSVSSFLFCCWVDESLVLALVISFSYILALWIRECVTFRRWIHSPFIAMLIGIWFCWCVWWFGFRVRWFFVWIPCCWLRGLIIDMLFLVLISSTFAPPEEGCQFRM